MDPSVMPDCAALAQRILESPRMGERMKRALIYLMQGEGYRPATRRAGLKESRAADLHRHAERLGVDGVFYLRELEYQAVRRAKEEQQQARFRELIRELDGECP